MLHNRSSSSKSSLFKPYLWLVVFFNLITGDVLSSVEALESISLVLFMIVGETQGDYLELCLKTTPEEFLKVEEFLLISLTKLFY